MTSGITEKSNKGLFLNEVEMHGKYALYIRALRDEYKLFSSFKDAYVTAAIIGFFMKKKETPDSTSSVNPASIFPEQMADRFRDLEFIYRTEMLISSNLEEDSDEDCINVVFKDDSPEGGDIEKFKEHMSLFNSYACGGLEYLYEKFKETDTTLDVVNVLYEFLHDHFIEASLIEDDELPDFKPDFS